MNALEKLRSKPEPVRRAIALWSSLAITFIIVAVWISSLPARFENTSFTFEYNRQ